MSLWVTDGTGAGTVKLNDFGSIYQGAHFGPVVAGGGVFFAAQGNSSWLGRGLWKSDGTAAGTVRLATVDFDGSTDDLDLAAAAGGRAFLHGDTTANGAELWTSDGTVAGTRLVKDIVPGAASSIPGTWNAGPWELAPLGGSVVFAASDGTDSELWRSDGTAAGSALVKNIYAGTKESDPRSLAPFGGLVLFGAYGTQSGLWRSDGTAAGTFRLWGDLQTSAPPAVIGPVAYFVGRSPASGLNRTDGTVAGTSRVIRVVHGGWEVIPEHLTAVGGALLFTTNGPAGPALWRSDGTAAGTPQGTVLVKDVRAGTNGSNPEWLTPFGGALYFTAFEDDDGWELWRSDGTAAGPDPAEALAYAWDLDADGTFGETGPAAGRGDEVGPRPRMSAAGLAAGQYAVAVRVTNTAGLADVRSAVVSVTAPQPAAPVVQAVTVGDGGSQRSMVTGLTVAFDAAVVPDAGAFALAHRASGAGPAATVGLTAANPSGDGRAWVLSFDPADVAAGGSLADGVYDLTVAAARVRRAVAPGVTMAADAGFKFHRLYSDADGDGDSDNFDLLQLRGTCLKGRADPSYAWWFDYDAGGSVDNLDVFQVRGRRGIVFQDD